MYQNSKIEARVEAVRLAALLKDVTSENIVPVSKQIEEYITEGIDLPGIYDPNSYLKDFMSKMNDIIKDSNQPIDPNLLKSLADA